MLKQAVDDVSHGRLPIGSVVRYGLFRFLTSAAQEGRDCCFGYVSAYGAVQGQQAARRT